MVTNMNPITGKITSVDPSTGEVTDDSLNFDAMSDSERWDMLKKMRVMRNFLGEQILIIESAWLKELQNEDATVKEIEGRGQVTLDRGTPIYDKDTISQLYTTLGRETCDADGRKLISTKITEQKKVDGVRVRQLLKHGKHVKLIVDDAVGKAIQKSPRIKLVERK